MTVERLLQSGDAAGALRAADELLAKLPSSPVGLLGRARALLNMGRDIEGELVLDRALKVAPGDPVANTIRANLDAMYGRDADAVERLRPHALAKTAQSNEALLVLLDILYHSGRRDEWRELFERPGPWRQDPRAALHEARRVAADDALAGVAALKTLLRGGGPLALRRQAGFEGVTLLDRAGEYRGAFDLAREVRAATDGDFDFERVLRPINEQLARAEKEGNWITPLAPKVEGVVIICALPRSGTTLLEQMLDRHPAISGIGEYAGLGAVCAGLRQHACWPRRPNDVPRESALALQRLYLAGAERNRRADARWTFDKNLRTWQSLPELAMVLPGAACISVERDPRDLATSLYLSHFQPGQQIWTTSPDSIRRTIELSQRVMPRLLEVLGIPHVSVLYEDLVEDPARDARRALALLGLEMDDAVLSPEQNTRAAMTQSVAQVRRPINRTSVGRWKNYAFAFDASWEAVVAEHERRRAHARGAT
jgi:tetratricopeptide (TPR) repeat protein